MSDLDQHKQEKDPFLPLGGELAVANGSDSSRLSGSTSYRGRSSSNLSRSNELCNVAKMKSPFSNGGGISSVSEAVSLCKKAYYNVAIYKNTIDVQSEFANSEIHLKGGTKKSRDFFKAWFKKIKLWNLTTQFFFEYYRSSNFFAYKTYYDLDLDNLQRFKDDYQFSLPKNSKKRISIPMKYIVLDPESLGNQIGMSFSSDKFNFVKFLNPTEISFLRKSSSKEAIDFLNSLPESVRKQIKSKSTAEVYVDLDPDRIRYVHGKKQDYEPFAVPMYFPVLRDINLKEEFKRAEISLARQVDYLVLLATFGSKDTEPDQRKGHALQSLLTKASTSRVIVADYTTKLDFIIPDFNKIMGPEKYEVVNRDIASGLMSMSFDEEKYANSIVKTKIFIERLSEARNAFLKNFLIPEMDEVAAALGFTKVPVPHFEEINIEDKSQVYKVYTRLVELGLLTPDELFNATENGVMPDKETSEENQRDYMEMRKQGYYTPLIGGAAQLNEDDDGSNTLGKPIGRPVGTKGIPQSKTRSVSPIGTSKASSKYSLSKMKETLDNINKSISFAEAKYKEFHGSKRLSSSTKSSIEDLVIGIVSSTKKEDWETSIASFITDKTYEQDPQICSDIENIMIEHELGYLEASVLYHSPYESNI